MFKFTFTANGREYEIVQDDRWYKITREDGKSLGVSASFHGAMHACTLDAYPREPSTRVHRARP